MDRRTRKRTSRWLAISAILAIAIVLLWKASLADQPVPVGVVASGQPELAPESAQNGLVERTDTVIGRLPSATTSTAASASRVEAPSPPSAATLDVVLLAGTEAIREGTIVLKLARGGGDRKASVDPGTRAATFIQLAIGDWRVEDITDLPEGLLPPRRLYHGSDFDEIVITVKEGSNRLEIPLERGARVFGSTRGADGEPIDNWIRFSPEAPKWQDRARPVDLKSTKGAYEGEIHAGLWSVELIEPFGARGERESLPPPRVVFLPPGSSTQVDFVLQRGMCRIEGRTLDEKGLPFAGLQLYVYQHVPEHDPVSGREIPLSMCVGNCVSGGDGGFAFDTLTRGSYVVDVEPHPFNLMGKPGESQVGAVYPGKPVEISDSERAQTELVVLRPHPCRVRGRVVVDPEWRRRAGVPVEVPTIKVLAYYDRPDRKDSEMNVDAWSGTFDFYLDASVADHDPRLVLSLGPESATLRLDLVPDAELAPMELRFPK